MHSFALHTPITLHEPTATKFIHRTGDDDLSLAAVWQPIRSHTRPLTKSVTFSSLFRNASTTATG